VDLDQFHSEEIVDWPRWCNDQITPERSDFVLCVCTAEYKRRIDGHVPPERGKGAYWEGSLIDDYVYDEKGNRRVIPVLLNDEPSGSILTFLRGWTHCRIEHFALDDAGYQKLLRIVTRQATVEKNELGEVPKLPTERAPRVQRSSAYDISRILKYAPAQLIGRDDEKKIISDAWRKVARGDADSPSVLTFVALGGEGKTSLVAKWVVDELRAKGWPECDGAFAWSFFSQGSREQVAASSDLFLKEALAFFGDDDDKAFAASPAGGFEKGQRLARIVRLQRNLLILDGLEPLQYPPTPPHDGALKDQGISALLKGLAASSRGLCIVTTRYPVPDLKAFWQTSAPEEVLLRLSRDAGIHLLRTMNVHGTDQELAALVEDVKGHALTLTLVGGLLKRAFNGDIRKRDRVKFEKADAKIAGGHAFRAIGAYENWLLAGGVDGEREVAVLRMMGLFDRPADRGCLSALRGEPIAGLTEPVVGLGDEEWEYCLTGLEAARLITVHRDASGTLASLDAHPLLRDYFARQLRQQYTEAWRAAHRRLYQHLCETPDKPQPTLEDLQPLYQAIAHGCEAGLHQDACDTVFFTRIRQGNDNYSVRNLGALGSELGAIACFFTSPWTQVTDQITEGDQGWIFQAAGYCLRALGRLAESIDPMRAGVEFAARRQNWKNASISSANLSLTALQLGELQLALKDANRSVAFADRGDDALQQVVSRTTQAHVLHQVGRYSEAEASYHDAEQRQRQAQPEARFLYSRISAICCWRKRSGLLGKPFLQRPSGLRLRPPFNHAARLLNARMT
jgi:hypothetical protein